MKWDFLKIQKTFENINKIKDDISNIPKIINQKKYEIEIFVLQFLLVYLIYSLEEDYIFKKKEYDEFINSFSYNYLIGSEIYIGDNYTREIYLDSLGKNKQKYETFFYSILFMLYYINESKNMGTSRMEISS